MLFPWWQHRNLLVQLTHEFILWSMHKFREGTHSLRLWNQHRLTGSYCPHKNPNILEGSHDFCQKISFVCWGIIAIKHVMLLIATFFFQPFKKENESHNTHKNKHALCVLVYVVSSIIHTTVFAFLGTIDTSQHNTAGAHAHWVILHTSHLLFSSSISFFNFSPSSSSSLTFAGCICSPPPPFFKSLSFPFILYLLFL